MGMVKHTMYIGLATTYVECIMTAIVTEYTTESGTFTISSLSLTVTAKWLLG